MNTRATSRFVIISEPDGEEPLVHASGHGMPSDWESMCGLDGHDDKQQQRVISRPIHAKINCTQCQQTILAARHFSRKDFA